jgi:putative ABC transport system ATP-binding protein
MQNLVEVREVTKIFFRGGETLPVLDKLSLSINQGEFCALMGPSGSGKTTLLNLIAGFDTPLSGEVVIGGTLISKLNEYALTRWRALNLGMIFQFYNLLPVLTALENVALPLSLYKMSRREQLARAKLALEQVGLGQRLNHLPKELSGGQEQRVAIARAIVTDPQLIIADEPTGDLDRKSAGEILTVLQALQLQRGKTIIMVTHDPESASYASRQIRLDKGQVL